MGRLADLGERPWAETVLDIRVHRRGFAVAGTIRTGFDDFAKSLQIELIWVVEQPLVQDFGCVETKRGQALVHVGAGSGRLLCLHAAVVLHQLLKHWVGFEDRDPAGTVARDGGDLGIAKALRQDPRQHVVGLAKTLQGRIGDSCFASSCGHKVLWLKVTDILGLKSRGFPAPAQRKTAESKRSEIDLHNVRDDLAFPTHLALT